MSINFFLFFFRLLQGSVSKELLTLATISTAFSLLMVSLKSELMLVNITYNPTCNQNNNDDCDKRQIKTHQFRVFTKISSCRVNTTSRWGIKQLGISFLYLSSVFL